MSHGGGGGGGGGAVTMVTRSDASLTNTCSHPSTCTTSTTVPSLKPSPTKQWTHSTRTFFYLFTLIHAKKLNQELPIILTPLVMAKDRIYL